MDSQIKTISLIDSDKKNQISVDSNELTKTDSFTNELTKTVTLSNIDITKSNEQSDTNKVISLFNTSETDKVISLLDTTDLTTDLTTDFNLSEIDNNESTKQFSISQINLKIKIPFNTLSELITITRNTCIKYRSQYKKNKFTWGILEDIILFDNKTYIILKKGPYIWKHMINFCNYTYIYIKQI